MGGERSNWLRHNLKGAKDFCKTIYGAYSDRIFRFQMYFVLVWLVEGLTMVLANTAAIELQIGTTLYKMSLVITEPHAEYKG